MFELKVLDVWTLKGRLDKSCVDENRKESINGRNEDI